MRTLDRAISSIFQQEFEDFECILVDNNSTDDGGEVAMDWEHKDKRFILIEEERQGVMFASNRGATMARGMYLARMDADDRALPCRLKLQSDFLDTHPDYGAVAGLVKHVGDPGSTEGFRRFVEWSNSLCSYQDIYNRRFIEAPLVNPSQNTFLSDFSVFRRKGSHKRSSRASSPPSTLLPCHGK